MYIMGDILRTMRKEVGLSYFNSIRSNEALAFFVNDIASNPLAQQNEMDANFRIKMIRFELAIIDRTQFIFIKRIYTDFIRPIFAGISIVVKYIIIIPLGHLLIKVFPRFFDKAQKNDELPK